MMGLRCSDASTIGMFGSVYFVGYIVGTTFLAKYGDSIGRIPMLRYALFITVVFYGLLIFVTKEFYLA